MKREYILLAIAIIISLSLSTIPYVVAILVQPPDRQFMGIVSNVPDTAQYMSWMKSSTQNWVIKNTLTPEPQPEPTFFNLQWLILGRFSAWLNLSYAWSLQIFRILASVIFMLVTYKLCKIYFSDNLWASWFSWILINFSAGFGWLLVVQKYLLGAVDVKYPLTIYVAEPVTFQNMIIYPHFLVAATLLTLIFGTFLVAIERKQLKYSIFSGFLSLLLGVSHGYDLFIVYGVLGVFTLLIVLRKGFSWMPIVSLLIVGGISSPPAMYFFYLTTTDPLWRDVLAQFKNVSVYTPDPLFLIILMGLPLCLTVFTFDGFFFSPVKNSLQFLIRAWLVVNFFLLYIPTDYQIHMLNGWQIPLGLLASEGLFYRLAPALSRYTGLNKIGSYLKSAGMKWVLVVILLLAILPTNIYLLLWRIKDMSNVQHQYYLYKDELSAINWLDANTTQEDVVFSGLTVGQYVPGLAGNKVYLGHWAQTVDFFTKQANVKKFFQPDISAEDRRSVLEQYNVKYVIYGREEKSLGSVDPDQLPYLTIVFETQNTKIYRTNFDNQSVQNARVK